MSNQKIVGVMDEEFERVRQSNPTVYNMFERFYRGEVTAEEAFATLAVMMDREVKGLRQSLLQAMEQTPSIQMYRREMER